VIEAGSNWTFLILTRILKSKGDKWVAEAARRRWGGWVWPPPARKQAFPATGAAGAGRVGITNSAVGNPQERLAAAN